MPLRHNPAVGFQLLQGHFFEVAVHDTCVVCGKNILPGHLLAWLQPEGQDAVTACLEQPEAVRCPVTNIGISYVTSTGHQSQQPYADGGIRCNGLSASTPASQHHPATQISASTVCPVGTPATTGLEWSILKCVASIRCTCHNRRPLRTGCRSIHSLDESPPSRYLGRLDCLAIQLRCPSQQPHISSMVLHSKSKPKPWCCRQ